MSLPFITMLHFFATAAVLTSWQIRMRLIWFLTSVCIGMPAIFVYRHAVRFQKAPAKRRQEKFITFVGIALTIIFDMACGRKNGGPIRARSVLSGRFELPFFPTKDAMRLPHRQGRITAFGL